MVLEMYHSFRCNELRIYAMSVICQYFSSAIGRWVVSSS